MAAYRRRNQAVYTAGNWFWTGKDWSEDIDDALIISTVTQAVHQAAMIERTLGRHRVKLRMRGA